MKYAIKASKLKYGKKLNYLAPNLRRNIIVRHIKLQKNCSRRNCRRNRSGAKNVNWQNEPQQSNPSVLL